MATVERSPVTLLLDAGRRDAIEAVRRVTRRDTGTVIDAHLDLRRWQAEHIGDGLRQAEAGEFASDEEVAAAFARWR